MTASRTASADRLTGGPSILLFVSALVAMLMRRLQLPYTVGLVLAGMGLYLTHVHLDLRLFEDLIFSSFFLPPLVFEAALYVRWTNFKKDVPVVTLGVLLAAAVTAVGMHYALGWNWGSANIFRVLIAATDRYRTLQRLKKRVYKAVFAC
jgi:monovalent cation:H+ antiporter, CPA1 family